MATIAGVPLILTSPTAANAYYPPSGYYYDGEVQSYTVPDYEMPLLPPRDGVTTVWNGSGWSHGKFEGDIVEYARTFVNRVPYVAYATDPSIGFDCSGFIQFLYKSSLGINLPHSADSQANLGHRVSASDARAGDWVWWPNQHIGLYIGNGQMIDSPTEGQNVSEHEIWGEPVFIRFNA